VNGGNARVIDACSSDGRALAQLSSSQPDMPAVLPPARRIAPAIMVVGVAIGVAIVLAALRLWFHYGTAVFFEMIASGIAACF
jgi:hypothetical protein